MGVEQQTDTGDLVPLAGAVYLFRPAGGDRGTGDDAARAPHDGGPGGGAAGRGPVGGAAGGTAGGAAGVTAGRAVGGGAAGSAPGGTPGGTAGGGGRPSSAVTVTRPPAATVHRLLTFWLEARDGARSPAVLARGPFAREVVEHLRARRRVGAPVASTPSRVLSVHVSPATTASSHRSRFCASARVEGRVRALAGVLDATDGGWTLTAVQLI
ncbi:Rv3235 family protein [Corynebacterium bovis]|uniref:Rv3235 family protein n=1 Tax=Corynebacterium bovis TaxID=36808 RepID=UPI00244B5ADE|nr:Rv3235 family protein [Corynebacterium bovis]MDH2455507.1 Rv3235 family protein [Corynebacterium bovis]